MSESWITFMANHHNLSVTMIAALWVIHHRKKNDTSGTDLNFNQQMFKSWICSCPTVLLHKCLCGLLTNKTDPTTTTLFIFAEMLLILEYNFLNCHFWGKTATFQTYVYINNVLWMLFQICLSTTTFVLSFFLSQSEQGSVFFHYLIV